MLAAGRASFVVGRSVAAFVDAYGEPCLMRLTDLGRLLRVDIEDDFTALTTYQRGRATLLVWP
jgi:hypothetical protein